MSKIMKLRQKKADLVKEARAISNAAPDNGVLGEAEQTKYDALVKDIGDVDAAIKREEALLDIERTTEALPDANADTPRTPTGQRQAGPFRSFGEQMAAVASLAINGGRDPRLVWAASGASEGVAADGGYLVQTDFSNELLRRAYDTGVLASRCRRFGIGPNSNGLKINAIKETSRANGSRWGGVQAYWEGEAEALTASRPKFRQIDLKLRKLTGLAYATDELLQDAAALGAVLNDAFAEEFGFKIDDAIVNGDGAGMPLGFLQCGALVTITKETSQAAATVKPENIGKMWARLWARSRKNAVWLYNQLLEDKLNTMLKEVKNVAGTENVGGIGLGSTAISYTPPGFMGNEFATLMGRPMIPIEQAQAPGSAGDISVVDLSQYIMIDKNAMESASSIHVRFLYDEMTFRFIYRCDGQPAWESPLTPFKGSDTLSPFVALGART